MTQPPFDLRSHVAIVTGANHGIGAATARTLAACGAGVLVSYLRIADSGDSAIPEIYRRNRAADAQHILAAIAASGGRAIAREADLADAAIPARLFDMAEAQFGHVDILVNKCDRLAGRHIHGDAARPVRNSCTPHRAGSGSTVSVMRS